MTYLAANTVSFLRTQFDETINNVSQTCTSRDAPEWIKAGVAYITTCCLLILPATAVAVTSTTAYPIVSLAATIFAVANAARIFDAGIAGIKDIMPRSNEFLKKNIASLSTLFLVSLAAAVSTSVYPVLGLAATVVAVNRAAHFAGAQLADLCEVQDPLLKSIFVQDPLLKSMVVIAAPILPLLTLAAVSTSASPVLALAATISTVEHFALLIGVSGGMLLSSSASSVRIQLAVRFSVTVSVLALTMCNTNPVMALAAKIALATEIPTWAQFASVNMMPKR